MLFVTLFYANSLEKLDLDLQDRFYQKQGVTDPNIVIVAIDDESLDVLGRWPWPRDYHGELVRIISDADPAVIGIDIIFTEPSLDPMDDEYMIAMIAQADQVVLPIYGEFPDKSKRGILEAEAIYEPLPALKEVADSGHINTIMDSDGVVRKAVLQFTHDNQVIDSFSWTIYQLYAEKLGIEPVDISSIPTDDWHRFYLKYSGEPFSFDHVPYHQVLTGEIDAEYFRDKIVLVGPYTVGISDYYFTPLAPEIPMHGIEIHANIIQQFIEGEFFEEAAFLWQVLLMVVLSILAFVLFYHFRPSISLFLLFGLLAGFLVISYLLSQSGFLVSLIYTVLLLIIQYITALAHRFIVEQREKKRIRDVFGKYVAPQIVGKILDEGEEGLKLGGTRREVTCLFVDIRGFTPLSETAEPEEVVSILNEFLTLCAQAIFDFDGTLDKFIGDATMAIFNAPFDVDNHQLRAVQAAWAMQQGAIPLQESLEKRFGKTVHFGVGIHTGPAVIGNIGADFRMDYTAIGNTVNTAARLESNAKPGQILISEEVYRNVKDHVEVIDLGTYQLKGKDQGIHVYQVDNVKLAKK